MNDSEMTSDFVKYNETHPQPIPRTGTFQGTIPSAVDGTFSFDVNLISGNINNAVTSGSYNDPVWGLDLNWDLNGGRGEFCADGKFEITGFYGTAENAGNSDQELDRYQTWLAGNASSFNSGTPITDGYFQLSVSNPDDATPSAQIILPIEGAAK
jgi:hypothetical protein